MPMLASLRVIFVYLRLTLRADPLTMRLIAIFRDLSADAFLEFS